MASCAFTVIFSNRNIKTVNPWYRSKKGLACRPAPIFTAYLLPRQPFSLPPLLPDGSGHGRSSHVDLNLLWLGFLALRDTQRQHAVLKIGFDGIWIHGIRKRKTAGEGAVGALHAKVILFVHFLFKLALAVFRDRKSTRLNSSHRCISYAVFCLKKKKRKNQKSKKEKKKQENRVKNISHEKKKQKITKRDYYCVEHVCYEDNAITGYIRDNDVKI